MIRYTSLALFVVSAALIAGCGSTSPETTVVEIPGYKALQEQFHGRDLTALRGRHIVLDPGHGGFFKGAVGPGGLTEAEVNLGVALYLRGLLEWAGAEIHMTRTADYDFLTPSDSTLTSDLAFRVSLTDSLQPDVFLSLHHNSTASLDRTINETQTYYPLGADGASLDLARAIHRHLVLNLEITPARIMPGNFHVLRNATVPAVLGEPAMISHPVMEDRLSQAASQRLEAEAYFLGLLDYFSSGSPNWSGARIDSLIVGETTDFPGARWSFVPDVSRPAGETGQSPGPDPATFRLTLNGREVPFHLAADGRTITWFPSDSSLPLPAVLELKGRNLKGRATGVRRTVLIPPQPTRVRLQLMPDHGKDDGRGQTAIRWSVSGSAPLPSGRLTLAPDQIIPIAGGTSGTALLPDLGGDTSGAIFQADEPGYPTLICETITEFLPEPWRWRLVSSPAISAQVPWSLRNEINRSLPIGFANQNVPLIPYEPGQPIWATIPGCLPLVDPDPANPDTARTVDANESIWSTTPLVPDLAGKVIILDPAGGGSDPDGTGPLGTRGASLNLETALLTRDLLEGCGAVVHLTRLGETARPDEEKVRLAGEVGADLFVTIGRSRQPGLLAASHHPGSETGIRWAELFLEAAGPLGGVADSMAISPSYAYLLRHTSCPAIDTRWPAPHSPRQEMDLSERGWLRTEARTLLLAVASLFGNETGLVPVVDVASVIANLPGAPAVSQVEWAELDGNLVWSPGPEPLNSFQGPGLPDLLDRHTLEIVSGTVRQLWLLERSGSGFEARIMFTSP